MNRNQTQRGRRLSLAFATVLLLAVPSHAYNEPWGPFEEDARPAPFPIHTYRCIEAGSMTDWNTLTFVPTNDPPACRVQLNRHDQDAPVRLTIRGPDGREIYGPTQVVDYALCADVFTSDFNKDGRQDVAVYLWAGGCGLAAGYCNIAFVISDGPEYKTTVITTRSPNALDFLDLNEDATCRFVHTTLVYGEPGCDGDTHHYWVYNLLELSGNGIHMANQCLEGFPKWIGYTSTGNHKATTQLTEQQKELLWKPHADILRLAPEETSTPTASGTRGELSHECLR